ncbi:hypothetical protein AVEN_246896-1 [Araneus ventricosus]|uniref:Peptidase A2 domain-containing protein n=2 Tax=Araneus ventricosus TaxID=182803 RepID=A0A4Y2WTQ0_ARAVE|nr:hypothetical protein AVEN_246896-1 [Araneus ventricosus]
MECRKFRLFVRDRRSNLRFLVDSGADVSIIPATSQNKKKVEYLLYAANGTEISTHGDITALSNDNVISTLNKSIKISNLLLKYPEISRPNLFPKEIKHDVKHFIETNGQPIHAKARQLDPKRLAIAKEEFTFTLNNEIIRPSNSQWSSPFFLYPRRPSLPKKGVRQKKAAGEAKKPPRRVGQRQDPAPALAFNESKRNVYKHCP